MVVYAWYVFMQDSCRAIQSVASSCMAGQREAIDTYIHTVHMCYTYSTYSTYVLYIQYICAIIVKLISNIITVWGHV